jgi:hypothetical protein
MFVGSMQVEASHDGIWASMFPSSTAITNHVRLDRPAAEAALERQRDLLGDFL